MTTRIPGRVYRISNCDRSRSWLAICVAIPQGIVGRRRTAFRWISSGRLTSIKTMVTSRNYFIEPATPDEAAQFLRDKAALSSGFTTEAQRAQRTAKRKAVKR